MPKYALCYRSNYRDENMSIHAEGCSDIERSEKREYGANVSIHEAASAEEARDEIMLDSELKEMGYTDEHVKIYPCCRNSSAATKAPGKRARVSRQNPPVPADPPAIPPLTNELRAALVRQAQAALAASQDAERQARAALRDAEIARGAAEANLATVMQAVAK